MKNISSDTKFSTKPGTACNPIAMPEIQQVITINVKELDGLVQRAVDSYVAALPFSHVTCVTVAKAAELLSCYDDTVRVYIKSGQLPASKLGKDYRIRIQDLEIFLNQRMTAGLVRKMQHPRKKVS